MVAQDKVGDMAELEVAMVVYMEVDLVEDMVVV